MSDMDYGRCTWHVGSDGSLTVYSGGAELVRLELSPLHLVGLAADMNKVAWSLMDRAQLSRVP